MTERSFGGQLGKLLLALLNATLILAALCLWLAWSAFSAAERVAAELSETASSIEPMRAEMRELTEEMSLVREDLAAAQSNSAYGAALAARLSGVEAELARLNDSVVALGSDPEALVDRAIRSAFAEVASMVTLAVLGRGQVSGSE